MDKKKNQEKKQYKITVTSRENIFNVKNIKINKYIKQFTINECKKSDRERSQETEHRRSEVKENNKRHEKEIAIGPHFSGAI